MNSVGRDAGDARALIVLLPIICLMCFFLTDIRADNRAEVVISSDTPTWDLRGMDFDGHHYVRTRGSVTEYVKGALLTPDEFDQSPYVQVGVPKDAAQAFTARTRFLMPDDRMYAITFVSVDYADRVFVNGLEARAIGRPGTTADAAIPQTATVYFTATPVDGVIEIVHQVSNFVHREGGNPAGLYIGSPDSIARYFARQTEGTALIMGGCLFLALVHLALFLMLRQYRANLYLALFCLVLFLRTGVTGIKVITSIFPDISWYVAFRIEYMAIPLICLSIVPALDAMFSGLIGRMTKVVMALLNGVAALFFAVAPTIVMTHALPFMYVVALACALYVVARFLHRMRTDRSAPYYIVLSGLVVFIYLAVREMLYHAQIWLFPVGYGGMLDFAALVFTLFSMVASFYETMRQVAARERALYLEKESLERVNRMKSELMATVSHEMRTPLAVMMGFAQLIVKEQRTRGGDAQTMEDLSKIASEAKRLSTLVDEVGRMSLSAALDERTHAVDVRAVAEQIARLYEPILSRKQTGLTVHVPAGLPNAAISADELTQVLFNLISNAGKHAPGGQIALRAAADALAVTVTVEDDGDGMSSAFAERAFERYTHEDENGTGIGLAICREIIEARGGHIGLESRLGEGTRVTFVLPAASAEQMEGST